MTFLFLLFALATGWFAYNLYRPIQTPGGASVFSFVTGWLTGELALHHVAWQLGLTFLFIWGGAVEGFFGAIAMSILVIAWIAMTVFYLGGERAEDSIELALARGLGAEYRAQVEPALAKQFPASLDTGLLIRPIRLTDPAVEVIKNVAFGTHGQKLDLYRPRKPVENAPVLLQIHGGAWTEKMGSKNEQAIPLMRHMAKRGWISVAVSYRLSPTATFPEHLIDCKEGLRWIKEHIASYGGDRDFVVVTGGSAGGHLTALMALTAGDEQYQPGFEDLDLTVQGAVPFYGVMNFNRDFGEYQKSDKDFIEATVMKLTRSDDTAAFERASPLYRVREDSPPFFVIHGNKDSLVPVDEARQFVEKLRGVSREPVAYAEIDGAQHAFDMFPSIRSEHVKHGVERFLAWTYSRYLKTRGSDAEAS